jgi:hypothetical protein
MAGKQQKLKKHSEPSKFVRAEARAQKGQNHEYRHEDVSPISNKPIVKTLVSAIFCFEIFANFKRKFLQIFCKKYQEIFNAHIFL